MFSAQLLGRGVVAFVAVAYVYGVFLGAFALAWEWAFRDGLPKWTWWQYLLAPLGIGFLALMLEAFWTLVMKLIGPDRVTDPHWKRAGRMMVVFLLMTAFILGPGFYKIAHQ